MKKIRSFEDIGVSGVKNIILFMPHPDDESFVSAGLALKAKKAGVHVRCVVFSKGEASTNRFGLGSDEDLTVVRYEEMQNALGWLSVGDYGILDYPDGYLGHHSDEMMSVVETELQEYPNAIAVTYEPDGAYGHPDHIALSKVVTGACKKSKTPLLYATIKSKDSISETARNMADDFDKINPLKPSHVLNLTLGESWRKFFALSSHSSQFGGVFKQLRRWMSLGILKNEYFALEMWSKDS